jgi:putative MATE family efflux protein
MQNSKLKYNMTEGPFLKKVAVFVLPLVFTGLLQCFYNAADLAVVGSFRGEIALAAVGGTGAITNLIIGIFMGLSVGAGVTVAHFAGAKNSEMVNRTVHTSLSLSLVCGVIVSVLGFWLAPNMLILMDTPENVLSHATLYIRIVFLGAPALILYNYAAAMVRSLGDTVHPLIFLSISGVVNVLLNLFFVLACGMGVEGVAIATIASQYLAAVMIVIHMYRSNGDIRVRFSRLRLEWKIIAKLLLIGIPSGVQTALFSLSNVLLQSSVNSLGDAVMAGVAAAASLEGFVVIALDSVYQASLTFVGQNVGAKKYENIKKIVGSCCTATMVMGTVGILILLPFNKFFLGIYIDEAEGVAAMSAGVERLLVVMPFCYTIGFMNIFLGALRSMGKSISAMVASIFFICVFRVIWVKTVFPLYPSVSTIFASYPISWSLATICNIILVVIVYKQLVKKENM